MPSDAEWTQLTDPAGTGYYYGHCYYFGYTADFWSSTEVNSGGAWARYLDYSTANVGRYGNNKNAGFSVRCVRD